jgi:hypothetical protein
MEVIQEMLEIQEMADQVVAQEPQVLEVVMLHRVVTVIMDLVVAVLEVHLLVLVVVLEIQEFRVKLLI